MRIFEPEEVKEEAPPVVVEPVEQTSLPPIVNRMIAHNPSVRTLLDELDIDTENVTIKPITP